MVFRIFMAVILFASAYFGYEALRMSFLQNALLSAADEHSLHPEEHDVTFVSFIDYNCPHCKDAHPVVMEALKQDGAVHYIPRPVDFIDTQSEYVLSRLPYAAAKQGKFWEMHEALIENYRVVDEQVLQDITLGAGIDQDQLMDDYNSEEIIELSEKNHELHLKLRLDGTPAYAIGPKLIFQPRTRTPTTQDFLNMFEEARSIQ